MKKIIIIIVALFISINVFNAFKQPYFSINISDKTEEDQFLYRYDCEFYKYKTIEFYMTSSSDLSKKEKICTFDIPKYYFDDFNLLDLTSFYYKNNRNLCLAVNCDLEFTSILVDFDGGGQSLASNIADPFNIDLRDYTYKQCLEINNNTIKLLELNSKDNNDYLEVFVELKK